ncbi:hypothetical protein EMCG_05508 [[Emmonsia] crescens]|uniref:Uncharacterized protein n=1 Tax=[Emmonsia] crescens TaxID=73230 RepID=A0A0G2J617_9EURO|nr:hypothetical protein EMCG_05508 [Emmonsia crescens UAMH 3008]
MPVAINSIENESLRISRDATVRALWKRVLEMGVVHIRGTPASGKSDMACILRFYVEKTSEMPIISLSCPMNFPQNRPTNAMYCTYYKLLNAITVRLLDLDDWPENPCVAMFSSYGSPSGHRLDANSYFHYTSPISTNITFTYIF